MFGRCRAVRVFEHLGSVRLLVVRPQWPGGIGRESRGANADEPTRWCGPISAAQPTKRLGE